MAQPTNVITDYGATRTHCAYCQDPCRFCVHGMMTSSMTVETFQDLVDIGWTRAGNYMYKPNLSIMCCPSYTIRLDAEHFIPSKNQKRALKKPQTYLEGGALSSSSETPSAPIIKPPKRPHPQSIIQLALETALKLWLAAQGLPQLRVGVLVHALNPRQRAYLPATAFLSSPVCLSLFHTVRGASGARPEWASPDGVAESLCRFFMDCKDILFVHHFTENQRRQWKALMQNVYLTHTTGYLNFHLPEGIAFDQEAALKLLPLLKTSNGDMEIGNTSQPDLEPKREDERTDLPQEFCGELRRKRRLRVAWTRSSFVQEEFDLYKKYQTTIHGELEAECTKKRYERFLVDSPLIRQPPGEGIATPGMGSFHVQYRVDDRAYFFWDPDFAPLSLGKISALMEIDWVKKACRTQPSLRYYLIGYYVHSCPKTQYKSDYAPSELLCPESYRWVKLTTDIRRRLSEEPYLALSALPGAECRENVAPVGRDRGDVSSMEAQRLQVFGNVMTLGECSERSNDESSCKEWSAEQRAAVASSLPFLSFCLKEWRNQAMGVSGQLIYDTSEFLPYC